MHHINQSRQQKRKPKPASNRACASTARMRGRHYSHTIIIVLRNLRRCREVLTPSPASPCATLSLSYVSVATGANLELLSCESIIDSWLRVERAPAGVRELPCCRTDRVDALIGTATC